jgi:multisubunit Na+/H+ antiporter MnhF subunit
VASVNWFLAAALVLQVALIPCAYVCWRFGPEHRVVALGLAGTVQALAVLCFAAGYSEPGLASLAVVLAALSSGGSVAFARFLERWL